MDDYPHLTSDLPGIGGTIRTEIEDFVVEEIPLYEPSGAGEHLYVHLQKVGISTHEAVRRLAHALGVSERVFGYAGLKDARAVARQTVSVQHARPGDVEGLELPGLTVISARRHKNKLRLGHLRGNRFHVRIRGVTDNASDRASTILDRLAETGVPNLFGPQRFGSKGDSHEVGRAILAKDPEAAVDRLLGGPADVERDPRLREARERYDSGDLEGALAVYPSAYQAERRALESLIRGRPAAQALKRVPRATLRLLVSAYQSHLFNRLVTDRMPDLGRLEGGDLAYLHDRGAVFLVSDPTVEQPRADAFEISPSAPLFGKKVTLAEGAPGERERAVLSEERIELDDFRLPGLRMTGERRPVRVPVEDLKVRPDGEGAVLVSFSLGKGSFATSVLREVMK